MKRFFLLFALLAVLLGACATAPANELNNNPEAEGVVVSMVENGTLVVYPRYILARDEMTGEWSIDGMNVEAFASTLPVDQTMVQNLFDQADVAAGTASTLRIRTAQISIRENANGRMLIVKVNGDKALEASVDIATDLAAAAAGAGMLDASLVPMVETAVDVLNNLNYVEGDIGVKFSSFSRITSWPPLNQERALEPTAGSTTPTAGSFGDCTWTPSSGDYPMTVKSFYKVATEGTAAQEAVIAQTPGKNSVSMQAGQMHQVPCPAGVAPGTALGN